MLLTYIKSHPAESIAVALALFNLLGKLAGEVQSPGAKKVLGFFSALGPDVIDALRVLVAPKQEPPK